MNTAREFTARLAELLRREHDTMADFIAALAEFERGRVTSLRPRILKPVVSPDAADGTELALSNPAPVRASTANALDATTRRLQFCQ